MQHFLSKQARILSKRSKVISGFLLVFLLLIDIATQLRAVKLNY